MYIVYYTSGEYDDYEEVNLFVTESGQKAKDYCKKFNGLIEKYYHEIIGYEDWCGDYQRSRLIAEVHDCRYAKIEVR